MKVLVVGGGGREHAIVWKLAQSAKVSKLYAAPGNAGIKEIAECVPVQAEDILGIKKLAVDIQADLVVVGPEVPLTLGLVDILEDAGIMAFGPNKKCANLEASKAFTKEFLERHQIPTAGYKKYRNKEELKKDVGIYGYPMVIKADGLAAGKGVVIAANDQEATKAIEEIMGDKVFGKAGDMIVVEEFLDGIEASMLCFVDENNIVPMESAQDYKRIFDGDLGPNTGGMGTYSPSLIFDKELQKKVREKILEPTLEGFKKDGLNFKGVLFIGLMIKNGEPKVIEFNNRFGDPETQAILPRLKTDLVEILVAVATNKLDQITLEWSEKKTVCVVLASEGYPGTYPKGDIIRGLENLDEGAIAFHSGTSHDQEGNFLTAGGRVLGIVGLGKTHQEARNQAFHNVEKVNFKGSQYRKDIGIVKE